MTHVVSPEDDHDCLGQDPKVTVQGMFVDIPCIKFQSVLPRQRIPSSHLCQPSYPRANIVAVSLSLSIERKILGE